MATKTWQLASNQNQTGGDERIGFNQQVLQNGRSANVTLITLTLGNLEIDVVPTRGMSLWQARKDGVRFGWDSPVTGPVHPSWVPLDEPSGLGWLDGFDELLVRCGLQNNGAPQHSESGILEYPLHGRIGNLPASDVVVSIDDSLGQLTLQANVLESRFHFYRLQLQVTYTWSQDHPNELLIEDRITNLSDRPSGYQMLYHTNLGSPVLEPGSKLVVPVKLVCPRNEHASRGIRNWNQYPGPDATYQEQVYFMNLQSDGVLKKEGQIQGSPTTALLQNASGALGFSVTYDVDQLPCFSLWKNTVGTNDGYVTGLEPGVNFPNRRGFEEKHGRVVSLAPGEARQHDLMLGFHSDSSDVASVRERIGGVQVTTETLREPRADLCE